MSHNNRNGKSVMTKVVGTLLMAAAIMLIASTISFAQTPIASPQRPTTSQNQPKPRQKTANATVSSNARSSETQVSLSNGEAYESTSSYEIAAVAPAPEPVESQQSQSAELTGNYGGHEWVDLGLPSGLKWATCNVGSNRPELFGDYFAWGEVSTKVTYEDSNSKTYKKNNAWLNKNGYLDSRGNLSISYDAARQQWGFPWRMPSEADFRELLAYTIPEWTAVNGINGWLFRSKVNGESIFFPVAGWRKGSAMDYAGQEGRYWSSTPDAADASRSCDLYLYYGHFAPDKSTRHRGRTIRAVAE